MKNLLTALSFILFISSSLFAQKNNTIDRRLSPVSEVPKYIMPLVDNDQLLATELDRRGSGIAPRFAQHMEVDINPNSHGLWETASNGNAVWRLRIYSKNAKSLNFGFSNYNMPRGGSLILYQPKRSEILGPFTPSDNEEHDQLWTPVVNGQEVVIEVQVPVEEKSNLQLQLKSVNHDFVGFHQMSVLSGSCNLDVICSEADGWGIIDGYRDIIRSVAVISTGGNTFCTGFLINNVNNDCAPFFMTADHCGIGVGNAASLVTYWNFESPVCRQPGSGASGGNGNGSLNDFNTGAIHRASWEESDMTLVELDDPVSESADAYFAGFTADFVIPQDTIICIHHPDTDEKRITFEFDPAQPAGGNGQVTTINNASHIRIPGWDVGTTEPGSSGSPLFNNQKQVVGQLHGGAASCGNASNNDPNDDWDYYGWFYTSWFGGGTPNTALRFWLDPNETGIVNMPGRDCNINVTVSPNIQEVCASADAVFEIMTTDNFIDSVTLSVPNLPLGATATFSQNPVEAGASASLTINTNGIPTGLYPFTIEATDGLNETSNNLSLNIFETISVAVDLAQPNNMATETSTFPIVSWNPNTNSSSYSAQIATDNTFTNIIASANNLNGSTFNSSGLEVLTTYYWRVQATNICGDGPWSDTWSFTTADVTCALSEATDLPIEISEDEDVDYSSTITVNFNADATISKLRVLDLNISHTYVGDLSATLTSPSGTVVQLFDRPGVPDSQFGCDNENLLVSFDETAMNDADVFEVTCEDAPAIGGVYQSIDPLSFFNNENPTGDWVLTVNDGAGNDGGSINNWQLDFCTIGFLDQSFTPSATALDNCTGIDYTFTVTLGEDFEPTGVNLSAFGNPAGSTVDFSSNPATAGETVTVTISNVLNAGTYIVSLQADDGTNNTSTAVTLNAQGAPISGNLNSPVDNSTGIILSPSLEWDASPEADSYQIEIASDNSFSNLVASENTTAISFTIPTPLEYNSTYFWRVITENECGANTSLPSSFTTEVDVAVDELEGNSFQISPNPSNGKVDIIFAKALDKDLTIEVYAIDGSLLQQNIYNHRMTTVPVSLSYPNGVYVIRLTTAKASVARRVLVQK
ncbi:MAG: subtilisin-like proprotein convertase family protein [Polaribacter sp.]|jgi:subtilisin-like proprotein convertase family protein